MSLGFLDSVRCNATQSHSQKTMNSNPAIGYRLETNSWVPYASHRSESATAVSTSGDIPQAAFEVVLSGISTPPSDVKGSDLGEE